MSSQPPKKSDWLTFQNMFTVAMALWGMYASFNLFREDTSKSVSTMQTNISWLIEANRQNQADIRALREERLERRTK